MKLRTSHHMKRLYPAAFLSVLCATGFAVGRTIPAGPPPADVADIADFQHADIDTKLAGTTLQGIVNQGKEARVLLQLSPLPPGHPNFWVEELKRKGYVKEVNPLTVEQYFDKYLPGAKGLVVYDPAVPGTMNVATMIAGVEQRMVVAPNDVAKYRDRAPDVLDLRGRWTTNAAGYAWAYETLWPKMNRDIVATYHYTHTNHHLRDYLVNQRVFTFWVTGQGQDTEAYADREAEKAVAEKVLADTPPNIPIIGWWSEAKDHGMTEYGGVGWAGEYGKITIGTDWQTNLSFLSGVPVPMDQVTKRFREREVIHRHLAVEAGKIYICFAIMESGDSPTYWHSVQRNVWADPKRGDIPVAWTITTALPEMLPTVAEWYLDNATPNDHFIASIGGWGYCHPYRGLMGKTPDPEAAWDAYLTSTAAGMRRLGLVDLGLYTDAWLPFRRSEKDPITRRFAKGIPGLRSLVMGMGRDAEITTTEPHYRLGDTLVSHIFTRWDATRVTVRGDSMNQWLANEIRQQTPRGRPAFMFVHALSWSYHPSDLVAVAENLGEDYVIVSPAELIELINGRLAKE